MFSSPVAAGTVLAGKYRVEEVLGRGGMGVVLAAWHLELDQRVALKFLSADLSESADAAERFRREARAAARIKSEHVVRVLDVGIVDEAVPFMVLEFLEGNDLEQEVQRGGPLPVSIAVDYVLQAIEAIAEAHAAGIVHRDLKPGNLFLFRRPDGTRMIKVLDFGISKSLPSTPSSANQMALTATASLIGSPLYMSPEQMQSPRTVDPRTDIWSLGAILYHLLAGEPPYLGENIAQLCQLLMTTKPTPLSRRRADVPPELERIIARCLEKSRDDRFSNVSDLASALARFASALSQVHVSRAQRILSSSNHDVHATVRTDTGTPDGYGTQSAWDREQTRRASGRPLRWVVPSAAALLVLAAAGAFVWTRKAVAPVEPATVSAAPPVDATRSEPAPVPARLDTTPRVSVAEPLSPPSASPGPVTSAPPALLGMPGLLPPSAPGVASPGAPGWKAAPTWGAKPAPSSGAGPLLTPPRSADNGLTDFGGRQ